MKVDYIVLAVVAVLGIGCGLLLRSEARKYRGRMDMQKATTLSSTMPARNRQREGNELRSPTQAGNQYGATILGNFGDEFASHEILDRINSVTMLLQILLLDRQDLPDSIRTRLDVASNTLLDAYQSMGKIRFNADTNQGASA